MNIKFTSAEKHLYDALAKRHDTFVSTSALADILERIRRPGFEPDIFNSTNLVAVHIGNLRKKLCASDSIQSARGKGYKLVTV